jgi:hypothetical protein
VQLETKTRTLSICYYQEEHPWTILFALQTLKSNHCWINTGVSQEALSYFLPFPYSLVSSSSSSAPPLPLFLLLCLSPIISPRYHSFINSTFAAFMNLGSAALRRSNNINTQGQNNNMKGKEVDESEDEPILPTQILTATTTPLPNIEPSPTKNTIPTSTTNNSRFQQSSANNSVAVPPSLTPSSLLSSSIGEFPFLTLLYPSCSSQNLTFFFKVSSIPSAAGYSALGPPSRGLTFKLFPEMEEWEVDYEDLSIGKVLGSGAFGVVKLAEWKSQQNRLVAVKFFHSDEPHEVTKCLKEMQLMW